jgi:hypothetical protein
MEKSLLDLKMTLQSFNSHIFETTMSGFILNYNGKNHIISVHHYLPVENVIDINTSTRLNIVTNCCWNEILILDTTSIDLSTYKINNAIYNRIPKHTDLMYIKTNYFRYNLRFKDHVFIPFDNIQSDVVIPMIQATILDVDCIKCDTFAGLSGSPIYINDKVIGILSKINLADNIIYVLPIYLAIKTLEKHDNDHVYWMNIKNIKKINAFNVKDNNIYHPTLKINIPLNTYFLLEGDNKQKISIQYKIMLTDKNQLEIGDIETTISNLIDSPTDGHLIMRSCDTYQEYKVNTRLLSLLHKFCPNKKLIIQLLIATKKNTDHEKCLWIKLNT